jgi:hypothetical protein
MGPRLITEATVIALIKFIATEAVGHFPGESKFYEPAEFMCLGIRYKTQR